MKRLARNEYLWVAAAFFASIFIAYSVLQGVLIGNFDKLERQNVSAQAARVSSALTDDKNLFGEWVMSNAMWTDAWNADMHRSQAETLVAFPPQQMRGSFGFDGVTLLNRHGVVVGGGLISASGSRYQPVSQSLAVALSKPTVASPNGSCGVLAAADAHYLYCAQPITHSDGSGPVAGSLVALRALNAAGTAAIGKQAGLSMHVLGHPIAAMQGHLSSGLGTLTVGTRTAGNRTMDLMVVVPAISGGTPLVLEATFDRPVHVAAQQSALTSAEIIGVLGVALLLISVLAQQQSEATLAAATQRLLEIAERDLHERPAV